MRPHSYPIKSLKYSNRAHTSKLLSNCTLALPVPWILNKLISMHGLIQGSGYYRWSNVPQPWGWATSCLQGAGTWGRGVALLLLCFFFSKHGWGCNVSMSCQSSLWKAHANHHIHLLWAGYDVLLALLFFNVLPCRFPALAQVASPGVNSCSC